MTSGSFAGAPFAGSPFAGSAPDEAGSSSTIEVVWETRSVVNAQRHVQWTACVSVAVSVSSSWSVSDTPPVVDQVEVSWNVSNTVTAFKASAWSVLAKYSRQVDTAWSVYARTTDTLPVQWDVTVTVKDDLSGRWNTLSQVSASRSTAWTSFGIIQSSRTTRWNSATSIRDDAALFWTTRSTTSDSLNPRWNVLASISSSRSVSWSTRKFVLDSLSTRWTSRLSVASSKAILWDVAISIAAQVVPYRYTTWDIEPYTLVDGVPRATTDLKRYPLASPVSSGPSGYWRVYIYVDGVRKDISIFREAPTLVSGITTTDPFGPATATLVFPAVSLLEEIGTGDLDWLKPELDVDIVWVNADLSWGAAGAPRYTWEGYLVSYTYTSQGEGYGLEVTCTGALRQLDNYLASPEYTYRPMTYEYAVLRQFMDPLTGRSALYKDLRLSVPSLPNESFPNNWTRTFVESSPAYAAEWSKPIGVDDGDKWSGLMTRETGNFEPALTGYIQGLLTNMQFDGVGGTTKGQFTMVLDTGRKPRLLLRKYVENPDDIPLRGATVLAVDLLWPGVALDATQDFTQRASVVYSQGASRFGTVYSGMQMSVDGSFAYYDPAAYEPEVFPPKNSNTALNPDVMRKEVKVDFGDGLTPKEAAAAAEAYLQRYGDPGITGSMVLDTDPLDRNGKPYPRQIIQAGSTILVKNLFGYENGILMHVTETSLAEDGAMTLTLDSKYRDQLTVDQVRLRGRDSLKPFRSISTAGTYTPKIPDLLYPWDYNSGAGIIPEWRETTATQTDPGLFPLAVGYLAQYKSILNPPYVDEELFEEFPWTRFTNLFPPRDFPQYYIRIPGRSSTNANYNWAMRDYDDAQSRAENYARFKNGNHAYRVKLSAKGEIRLLQMAAYGPSGNVKKVPFHVSIFTSSGISPTAMPMIAAGSTLPDGVDYAAGQHYPFFAEAWEKVNPDGTTPTNTDQLVAADNGTFLAGWGTYYERAGYWPGSYRRDDPITGLLQDEVGFSWDFTADNNRIDVTKSYAEQTDADVWAYVMVYCDASTTDTYFLGRLWHKSYEADGL